MDLNSSTVNGMADMTISDKHDWSQFMSPPITDNATLLKDRDQMRTKMELLVLKTQAVVCLALEELDDTKFKVDRWSKHENGGGVTCVLEGGTVFEKAGVNVSVMRNALAASTAQYFQNRGKNVAADMPYFASGVSAVIHPRNPHCPTVHFNYRYFEVERESGSTFGWFGGGTDITPYVLDDEDIIHFHRTFKNACDAHSTDYYPRFKKWCDEYFMIPHRGETRGVGGIFFDDLVEPNEEALYKFVKSCTEAIVPSYVPIIKKNMNKSFTDSDKKWQLIRRGRYAEYNLVYDRGTKFGLVTPGTRMESILMSMPPLANWEYAHEPEAGSKEARLLEATRKPREWVK